MAETLQETYRELSQQEGELARKAGIPSIETLTGSTVTITFLGLGGEKEADDLAQIIRATVQAYRFYEDSIELELSCMTDWRGYEIDYLAFNAFDEHPGIWTVHYDEYDNVPECLISFSTPAQSVPASSYPLTPEPAQALAPAPTAIAVEVVSSDALSTGKMALFEQLPYGSIFCKVKELQYDKFHCRTEEGVSDAVLNNDGNAWEVKSYGSGLFRPKELVYYIDRV